MAQTLKASVVLASALTAAAVVSSGSRGFLANRGGMRPDVVAATLVKVEDEWAAQAAAFVECSTSSEGGLDCDIPGKAFKKSCGTIVSAVVQASAGDRDSVYEYMNDVCKESALDGAHRAGCKSLRMMLAKHMSSNAYANRESFDPLPLCNHFWQSATSQEKQDAEQHLAEKAKAEAERKKAEEQAAEQRRAEEDAKIVAANKKAEEAAKAAEEAALAAKSVEESTKKEIQDVTAAADKVPEVVKPAPAATVNTTAVVVEAAKAVPAAAVTASAVVTEVVKPALVAAVNSSAVVAEVAKLVPAAVVNASAVVAKAEKSLI